MTALLRGQSFGISILDGLMPKNANKETSQVHTVLNQKTILGNKKDKSLTLPITWVLASPHAGDNRQLLALATALGSGFVVKTLQFRSCEPFLRIFGGASCAGLSSQASEQLSGPNPDLVIMAGRANEAVALWIKKIRNSKVKLVYVGTPWNQLALFDLVIATPQYSVPALSNVLHIKLPLHDIQPQTLISAKSEFLAGLPRPITAVLIGGPSGPYGFYSCAGKRVKN